jgi:hypothetical protein
MPPFPPTPPRLQKLVIEDINWMAGPLAQKVVTKKQKLDVVFGLTAFQRRALAAPFEASGREFKSDVTISRLACEKLSTVGDAVALVSKSAGFDGSFVEADA